MLTEAEHVECALCWAAEALPASAPMTPKTTAIIQALYHSRLAPEQMRCPACEGHVRTCATDAHMAR